MSQKVSNFEYTYYVPATFIYKLGVAGGVIS